jgi:hypothetical protein
VKKRFMITAVAALALVAAFATTAQAFPEKTSACSGCHNKSAVVGVTAVEAANDGVTATYDVTVTGPNTIFGWAVLSGSTNKANGYGSTGTFQVPVGKTYTVWGVSKSSSMPYSNSITVSPVAPVVTAPEPTTTPVPTSTPEPTVTPTPATGAAISLRMHFEHAKKTVVKLTNADTGEAFLGSITRKHNRVTFLNVPDGTYVLTTRYKHHKTKKHGTYVVADGKISKVAVAKHHDDDEDDD